MYEEFFGLTEKPFSIQPDPSFLYWGRTHRLAYAMLEYGVLNHAGISVITGEVGCGKTTLLHRLLDQLSNTHTVALLSNVQEGRGDLLSWVLMGFGEPFAEKSHVELFSQLQSFFISEYAKGKRVILIIDEAQNLSMDMLEELRLLSNINAGKDHLLQLILVGQPQLKGLLNRPELLQLAQRVGSDFHLTPLNNEEVHSYIETRLAIAGCRRRLFTNRAMDLIAEQSRGVPRVINVIADTALVYAFSAQELVIGVEIVRNVIRDKTDYGVFGIASDEKTAPPMAPREGGGPDAFVEQPPTDDDAFNDEGGANSQGEGARRDERGYPPQPRSASTDSAGEAPAAASDYPVVAPVAKAVATHRTAAIEQEAPAPKPSLIDRAVAQEESAVTGVVIIGVNPKVSPEATIRSAGDSRAVVFAPVGASEEALAIARRAGAVVVDTTNERALTTGGRARNAGYRQLKKIAPHLRYVQFVDAGSALDPDWIATAEKFMNRRAEVTMVQGAVHEMKKASRRSKPAERNKDGDDRELSTVEGSAVLMRVDAFEAAGGFRGDLPVCETEDLCVRQRRRGAHIWSLPAGMLIEDKRRAGRRGWWPANFHRGYEAAFLASIHGGPPDRLGVLESAVALFWGLLFPIGVIAAAALGGVASNVTGLLPDAPLVVAAISAFGIGVYGLYALVLILQRGFWRPSSWGKAFATVFGHFPAFFGILRYWFSGKG